MSCTHRTPEHWVWQEVELDSFYCTTEQQLVNIGSVSTQEDLDVGRFRCTQCGEVGYYTGLWRAYHEQGIPCAGSDSVRHMTPN